MKTLALTLTAAAFSTTSALAGVADVSTPADVIHPNIHQNVGGGNNANPNGANDGGGNLHGIANVPGQSDADPATGEPGFADQLGTVHGGIGSKNKNAN
ncbi:MAG: hypothetical protein KUG58_08795 [Marinosulfonomonas sp.]|nr:hypothetical protein [Marinosulfonomonas sp.]